MQQADDCPRLRPLAAAVSKVNVHSPNKTTSYELPMHAEHLQWLSQTSSSVFKGGWLKSKKVESQIEVTYAPHPLHVNPAGKQGALQQLSVRGERGLGGLVQVASGCMGKS